MSRISVRNALFFSAVMLVTLTTTGGASGAVFERDWKMPGDGLLTFDDVNQREWLDIPVSRLDQFAEPRFVNAIAEISPGGLFEGFAWAKRNDVIGFAQSAGIDTATAALAINESATRQTIVLLGATFDNSQVLRSIGFINEIEMTRPFPSQVGAAFIVNEPTSGGGFAGLFVTTGIDSLGAPSNGLMLYRVVPEPSPAFLAIAALSGLVLIRSRC